MWQAIKDWWRRRTTIQYRLVKDHFKSYPYYIERWDPLSDMWRYVPGTLTRSKEEGLAALERYRTLGEKEVIA